MTNEAQMPITDEARYLAQYQADSTATISTVNVYDEARKALADIYGYALRPSVDYQSGDGTNAPAIIFADADYEVGDGKCGLHEDSKSANEPAIIYVRSDALEAAHAQIKVMREALENCEEYFDERADAEYFPSGPVANEEMLLMVEVQSALAGTPAEAATAFEARIRADERERIASQDAKIAAIRDVLDSCEEYFDKRADAEYFTGSPRPIANEEMTLLVDVRTAIRAMKGEGDE